MQELGWWGLGILRLLYFKCISCLVGALLPQMNNYCYIYKTAALSILIDFPGDSHGSNVKVITMTYKCQLMGNKTYKLHLLPPNPLSVRSLNGLKLLLCYENLSHVQCTLTAVKPSSPQTLFTMKKETNFWGVSVLYSCVEYHFKTLQSWSLS